MLGLAHAGSTAVSLRDREIRKTTNFREQQEVIMMRMTPTFHVSTILLATVLALGPISSAVGCGDDDSGDSECGGHGELSGSQCVCDDGYTVDPGDALNCIETPGCGGHGVWDAGECVCSGGYMVDPNDAFNCIEIPECSGHGQLDGEYCVCEDGYAVDPDDGTTCIEDGSVHEDGVAIDVEFHLHVNDVKIDLYTLEVLGEQEEEYDLFMGHDDPVDGGPNMHLGPGVTAQSLGNSQDYHAVSEAPADGYQSDDPGNGVYVIGSSWRNGGNGTVGFNMTENVYAVRLPNGTYAKIEILSAQGGTIHMLCYLQPDGSRDLSTTAP
jgi:hypothetical protein